MIKDYQDYLLQVEQALKKTGMTLKNNSDFSARFEREDKWSIIFEGERYVRPSIDLLVVTPDNKTSFSVRILMKLFSKKNKNADVLPSLTNQLTFIVENINDIFIEPQTYKGQYSELNELALNVKE